MGPLTHNWPQKLRPLILTLVVGIVLIWGGGALVDLILPRFINPQAVQTQIQQALQKDTGLRLASQSLKIHPTLFSGIQVYLNNIVLRDPQNHLLAKVAQLKLRLRYGPLIKAGTKEISSIHLEQASAYIEPNSFFFRLKLPPPSKKPEVEFKNTRILLTHYEILANHSLEKYHAYRLFGDRMSLRHINSSQSLKVKGSGQLNLLPASKETPQSIGRFVLRIQLAPQLIQAKAFKPIFLQRLNLDLTHLQLAPIRQIASRYGVSLNTKPTDTVERLHLDLRDPGTRTGQMEAGLETQRLKAVLGGKLFLKQPFQNSRVNLKASTNRFPLSTLHMVPQDLPLGTLLHQLQGEATLHSFQLQGPLTAVKGTQGDLEFHQVSGLQLRSLTGRVQFDQKQLQLQSLQGFLGQAPFKIQAALLLQDKILKGNLQTQKLPLPAASQLLHTVRKAVVLPLPAALDRFSLGGAVDLNIRMDGSFKQPDLQGDMHLYQVALFAKEKPQEPIVDKIQGSIRFEPDLIRIPALTALLHGNRFQVSGQSVISRQFFNLRLIGRQVNLASLQISAQQIAHLLGIAVPALDQLRITGSSNLQLNLTGPLRKPVLTGQARLANGRLLYLPYRLVVQKVSGAIFITPTHIDLNPLHGQLDSAELDISGKISKDFKNYRVALSGKNIDIPAVRRDILAKLPQTKVLAQQIEGLKGKASLALVATPDRRKNLPLLNGTVTVNQFSFTEAQLPYPIELEPLTLKITNSQNVVLTPTRGRMGPLVFKLKGTAHPGGYDLQMATERIPVQFLQDHRATLQAFLPTLALPELRDTTGSFRMRARLQPQEIRGGINFREAGFSWAGGDFPVRHLNGSLRFKTNPIRLHSDKLAFQYGYSNVASTLDYSPGGKLVFNAQGDLSPQLVNHYLFPSSTSPQLTAHVPFNLKMDGILKSLAPGGKGNSLDTVLTFQVTDGQAVSPGLQTVGQQTGGEKKHIPEAQLSTAFHLRNDQLTLDDTLIKLYDSGSLMLKGSIDKLFTPTDRKFSFRAVTDPELDLSKLEGILPFQELQKQGSKKLGGVLTADLTLNKTGEAQGQAIGFVDFRNISVPMLELENLTGRVSLDGLGARLNVERFQIPGVSLSLRGTTENVLESPITLENVQIEGDSFNVADFTHFTTDVLGKIIPPPLPGAPTVPIQFRNATVAIQEVVYQNILLNNYSSLLSLYPTSFFELNEMKFNTTGGSATGTLSMNPQDKNFLAVELNLNNVKANPLAIALLELPNTIFGNVNGNIRFTTQGMTDIEMLNHTNGTATISIKDGRLPALAKVETLLTAVNILRGGVLGFNLNNLVRTLDPLKTNYFAELSGNFQIAEGTLYTKDLLSDGENLDLLIQGKIRMADGNADLRVIGTMSQTVSGILGPLGKLSVGNLVQYVPGLGYLPGYRPGAIGLLRYIPGLGYIPGFGGPSGEFNRFSIDIIGPLADQRSVKNLQWLP